MHCTIQLGYQLQNLSNFKTLMLYNFNIYVDVFNFRKRFVNQYNVSVRFLATQGGLSRWQHMLDLAEGELYVHHIEYQYLQKI